MLRSAACVLLSIVMVMNWDVVVALLGLQSLRTAVEFELRCSRQLSQLRGVDCNKVASGVMNGVRSKVECLMA
jgi:hypothetical protein